ncbi:MAG: hypothetical protein L0I17_01005 [Actinomycetia bacterium]|nr:hypothetical protein [Actinomycetes bacterium]
MRHFRNREADPFGDERDPWWRRMRRPGKELFEAAAHWAEASRARTLLVGVIALVIIVAWFLLLALVFGQLGEPQAATVPIGATGAGAVAPRVVVS